MRNPNNVVKKVANIKNILYRRRIQINHPLLKGGLLLMKIVYVLKGAYSSSGRSWSGSCWSIKEWM